MLRALIFFALLPASLAVAQDTSKDTSKDTPKDSLHVYYYSGESIEQMNIEGVTVTITLKDIGRMNQVAVYVDNRSPDSVNVIPSNFSLHQNSPTDKDLAMKPDQEVQKISGRKVWGKMGSGIGHATGKMIGKDDAPAATAPPDYDAQARWLAHADELGQRGDMAALGRSYLRGSTVFPGSKFSGVLWFDRNDAFASGVVRVVLGSRNYQFPFPPPEWATTPSTPGQSNQGTQNSATDKAGPGHQGPAGGSSSTGGVLGISGEDWAEGGFQGVKILEVAHSSSAELAGLYPGCVITEVEATRVHTTAELATALAQRGPGSRVSITYLVNTHLGWMPKVTAVILGRAD